MNTEAAKANGSVIVRDVAGQKELRAVEDLQREVWGIPDIEVVPMTQIIAAKEAGGILIGAFDGDRMVGFAYGFVGLEQGRFTHHSHMLAVLPRYRDRSLGQALKLAQREQAAAQGLEAMTWTFDPLQSLNAHFNFSKLGVESDRYLVDLYGTDAASFLHKTGTDRLWVTWDLKKDPGSPPADAADIDPTLTPLVSFGDDELPVTAGADDALRTGRALIEIPSDINELAQRRHGSGVLWRAATRAAFCLAFERGFTARGFYRKTHHPARPGVYVLERA